ncbi:5142_t:CDS:2 [Gigaspora rosea]|nr:5142_t:CDS:2 [Gigaspora rosea]
MRQKKLQYNNTQKKALPARATKKLFSNNKTSASKNSTNEFEQANEFEQTNRFHQANKFKQTNKLEQMKKFNRSTNEFEQENEFELERSYEIEPMSDMEEDIERENDDDLTFLSSSEYYKKASKPKTIININYMQKELANKKSTLSESNIPQQLMYHKTEYEVANWVASRPSILHLAQLIYKSKKRSISQVDNDSAEEEETIINNHYPLMSLNMNRNTIEDRVYKESRALFLRTRNNTTELYEELAARILNTKCAHPEIPNLTKKIGVNKMAVDDNEVIKKGLKTFVIEMVKQWVLALHEEKDAKGAIKEFDELTLDLPIPTNYNIVAQLPVRKLLQYKK